jgi:hypothetical protein
VTRHDPQSELAHYIARLNRAWHLIPEVRQGIAERIADAATPTPGQGSGSGISRPTEAAARRIEGLQDADRAILAALRSLGKAIDHLDLECRRGLGTHRADTSQEPRCPVMELHVSNEQAGPRGTVMVRCGALSEAKLDERGVAVGWDADGYCARHRAEAKAQLADADAALAMRLRRKLRSA